MKKYAICIAILFAVSTIKSCGQPLDFITIEQGIRGEVLFWEGDFMPRVPNGTGRGGTITPVSRVILIHEPTLIHKVERIGVGPFIKRIDTKLVGSTRSNRSGIFSIELPPGQYSLFTVEEKGYYASGGDGQGILSPVVVEKNKITEVTINITYAAAF